MTWFTAAHIDLETVELEVELVERERVGGGESAPVALELEA